MITNSLTHGSLFSGIGGFDLAAEWIGWENIFHCEIAEYPRKLLKQYWPNAKSYEDIKKTDFTIWKGQIDILTGSPPCQPFSVTGKRKGKNDERHLWPEMFRAIREISPRYVVAENVYGLVNWKGGMVFHEMHTDLEVEGYEVQSFILPACAVNAPHKRDRIWFVAHSNSIGRKNEQEKNRQTIHNTNWNNVSANSSCKHGKEFIGRDKLGYKRKKTPFRRSFYEPNWTEKWTEIASKLCRVDDGLSKRLDTVKRIKALGNAILPQLAYEIFKVIQIIETNKEYYTNP